MVFADDLPSGQVTYPAGMFAIHDSDEHHPLVTPDEGVVYVHQYFPFLSQSVLLVGTDEHVPPVGTCVPSQQCMYPAL